ncbi:uncharacterized protein LOC111119484 [Crassostrea virginica]
MTTDKAIKKFTKTGDWEPLSIHSSGINGDILVGMTKNEKAKITRYNQTGKEIQNIQRENHRETLYRYQHFITENINGDICTSDYDKKAVVVVNKSGQHRFSYTGGKRNFSPYGICTDVLGHILVCHFTFQNTAVHLLDQDGHLKALLTQPEISRASCICVDNENNLCVGSNDTVTVFKYLKSA